MSADKQLKAYVDRVLRLKEEQDTLGDDIREVYAEAKSEGYDKTIMGKLVAHLRKVAKSGEDAVSEQEMNFDTYLQAYHRASGTRVATHTHEEKFDPDTGEILDGSVDAKLVQTIAAGVQTEIGRKALIAAVDIMIEREEAEERRSDGGLDIITKHTEIATALQGEAGAPSDERETDRDAAADEDCAGANAGGDDVESSAARAGPEGPSSIEPSGPEAERATHSPETANEMDRSTKSSFAARSGEAENARKAVPETEHGSVTHAEAGESPAPSFLTKPPSPLRPNCQRPENCGGYGRTHCGTCLRANEREFA